jgi:hypothetical protein
MPDLRRVLCHQQVQTCLIIPTTCSLHALRYSSRLDAAAASSSRCSSRQPGSRGHGHSLAGLGCGHLYAGLLVYAACRLPAGQCEHTPPAGEQAWDRSRLQRRTVKPQPPALPLSGRLCRQHVWRPTLKASNPAAAPAPAPAPGAPAAALLPLPLSAGEQAVKLLLLLLLPRCCCGLLRHHDPHLLKVAGGVAQGLACAAQRSTGLCGSDP